MLGLPDLLPASLDPEFRGQKLLRGASFGSSASGFADSTSIPLVRTFASSLSLFLNFFNGQDLQ